MLGCFVTLGLPAAQSRNLGPIFDTFQDNHQEERIPDHAGRTVHVGGVAQNTGHSLWRPEVNEAAVLI